MRALRVLPLVGLAGLLAVGGAVLTSRLLAEPERTLTLAVPPTAGSVGVAHAVAELVMRGAGVSGRTDPVEVTATELNGFLARHIETRRLPFRPLLVRAEQGRLEVSGRTSLGRLEGDGWVGWIIARLPDSLRGLEVWVSAEGRIDSRPGEAAFVVERAALGRQAVSPAWLWRVVRIDPREQLAWKLPRIVERVEVQPGRLLLHTRQPGR